MSRLKKHRKPQPQKPKKRKFWNPALIITALIALVMITSIIGFVYKPEGKFITDMNLSFETTDNNKIFIQDIENSPAFRFLPSQLTDLEIPEDSKIMIQTTPMFYLTFDPEILDKQELELARFELTNDMQTYFNKYVSQGVDSENTSYTLPVITCANASTHIPVLYFKSDNQTSIAKSGNCIFFRAEKGSEFLRIKDKLLYLMLNI